MAQTGEVTSLNPASTKGKSLRTTVPMSIIHQFNLEEGDQLRWEIRASNNELVLIVKPVKVKK